MNDTSTAKKQDKKIKIRIVVWYCLLPNSKIYVIDLLLSNVH